MSGYPPGPPVVPTTPCRRCFFSVPFGSRVCPNCGAAADFVPVAERTNNTGPTFLGIGATFVAWFVLPLVLSAFVARGEAAYRFAPLVAILDAVVFFGLIVACVVLLVRNPRSSPRRAFAFAALMTMLVLIGLSVIVIGGFFLVCYLIIQSSQHH